MTINYASNAFATLVGLVYFVGFWGWRGQTPRMIPFNMPIVMADDGSKPDWVRMRSATWDCSSASRSSSWA